MTTATFSPSLKPSMPLLVGLMLLLGSLTGCVSDMTGAEEESGPRTLQVERSEGGRTNVSGQHAPFATAKARYVTGQNMMSTEATVTALGSIESPSAFAAVYNDWSNEAGRYRVTANVNWNGALVLNGLQGQTAAVKIELKIYTFEGTLLARERIHTRSLEQSGVALPSDVVDRAGDSVVLDFDVPENTGGPFRIQFETTCSAGSAALAAGTHCGYNVNWSRLEVTQF